MTENQLPQQSEPTSPPPLPGLASPVRTDSIDEESADAKSAAASEGTGLTGTVDVPKPDEPSWMQDA